MNSITNFLSFRKQRVVLNRQASPWASTEAGVPHGSKPGPLLFLVYINDPNDLSTTAKFFADDTSLFSIVQNVNTSASYLNSDLSKISNWAFQLKVIFSRKIQKTCHPSIYFNNKSVKHVPSQKHEGIILDNKLNFQEHLKNILNTEIAKNFATWTTISNLQIIYRTSFDYGDVIYE